MAFDLDDDELRATREMHKLSDKNVASIDDDINKLNKFCEYEDAVVLCEEALYEIQEAIERILSERGQDKARIKELEEANKIFALEGSKVRLSLYIKENYIPIQKIQDKIEELNNQEKELQNSITEEEREEYEDANISFLLCDIEIRREVLKELLQEGNK